VNNEVLYGILIACSLSLFL